jgi:hypothetical protein
MTGHMVQSFTAHIADIIWLASEVLTTIRINNQAIIKAVQSTNNDVFFTHVTSIGGGKKKLIFISIKKYPLKRKLASLCHTGQQSVLYNYIK